MKCPTHEVPMEWIAADIGFQDGFWSCEVCVEEEEARIRGEEGEDYEDDDRFISSQCVFCGSQMHDGYCWASPNGNHLHGED